MDIGVISVRYARALIKAALGMKLEDQVYQEMQTLYKSYIDVPELRFTIDNPMLSKDKKEAPCNSWLLRISLFTGNRRTSSAVS